MQLRQEDLYREDSDESRATSRRAATLFRSLRNNPAYYFENLLKIETKAGTLEHFKANEQQRAVINLVCALRELGLPVRIIVCKARQIGMSTLCAALLFHATSLWPHRHSKVVAHDLETTEMLYEKSKLFYSELPDEPLVKPLTAKYTRKGLAFAKPVYSKVTLQTAGSNTVGTGQTIQNLHLSEVSKWENPGTVATSFMQSVPGPNVTSETMIIYESTADGYGDFFHETYLKAKEGKDQLLKDIRRNWHDKEKLKKVLAKYPRSLNFIPLFFPWHEFSEYTDPIPDEKWFKGSLTREELRLKAKYKLTLGQLQFRRRKIDELAKDERGVPPEELFKQEYPSNDEEAFIVTGQTYFSQEQLVKMKPDSLLWRGHMRDDMMRMKEGKVVELTYDDWKNEVREGAYPNQDDDGKILPQIHKDIYGPLKIFEYPAEGDQYAVAVDVAIGERENSDKSCIQVVNKRTGNQAAIWWGSIHPATLGKYAVQLGGWYNEAIVGPENNSFGVSTVHSIQKTLYPFPYIKNSSNYKTISEAPTEEWGWNTNPQTKPMVCAQMRGLIDHGVVKFNDEPTIQECRIFRQDGVKLGAPQGQHDDRVMAMAIALWIMSEHPYQPGLRSDAIPLADEAEMRRSAEIQAEDYEEDPSAFEYA